MAGKSHKNVIALGDQSFNVYGSSRLSTSLAQVTENLTVYQAAKWAQILRALYEQGKKDGAKSVFEAIAVVEQDIPHRNPGQPKKRKS